MIQASPFESNFKELCIMKFKYIFLLVLLVMSIQVGATLKTNNWSSSVGFGMNLTRATTDTSQFNGDFSLIHKTVRHEFLHKLNASYGKNDAEVSENNVNALLQWNQIVSENSYFYGNSTFRYDDIANIYYRVLVGGGVGHYFIQRDRLLLAVETGPSYLIEKLRIPDDESNNYSDKNDEAMWRIAQRYKQDVGDASKLWETVEYMVRINDADKYFFNVTVGLDVPINSHFDLRVSVDNKYDSGPPPDTDSNNLSMRVALVYRLLGQ